MRYPPDHKDRVRERIVRAASRRFRAGGARGVAIAELMRDLDLTHGGFYRHFKGKEQLFVEALGEAFVQSRARLLAAAERAPGGRKLEAVIDEYLSPGHCANRADGCPVAALAGEIARQPRSLRAAFDRAAREHAAIFAPLMPGKTAVQRERAALMLFAGMSGALNLARATSDEGLRRTILEQARAFYSPDAKRGQ